MVRTNTHQLDARTNFMIYGMSYYKSLHHSNPASKYNFFPLDNFYSCVIVVYVDDCCVVHHLCFPMLEDGGTNIHCLVLCSRLPCVSAGAHRGVKPPSHKFAY